MKWLTFVNYRRLRCCRVYRAESAAKLLTSDEARRIAVNIAIPFPGV